MTLDVDRLIELAELCEAASGPDRELDELISASIQDAVREVQSDGKSAFHSLDGARWVNVAIGSYTASLDAALSLVPEGSWWHEIKGPRRYLNIPSPVLNYWSAHLSRWNHKGDVMGWGATPALAMCVASLKARAMSVAEQKDASI